VIQEEYSEMAGSVNKVIILGTLGKDPESVEFSNGGGVVNLSISTRETWKDKNTGEKKEKIEWHRVAIFNDVLGEIVEKYARKGDKIYVEGQIATRKYTDNNGVEKFSTEITVKGFQGVVCLIGKTERREGGNGSRQSRNDDYDDYGAKRSSGARYNGGGSGGSPNSTRPQSQPDDLDDEIPFISNDLSVEPYLRRKRARVL